MGLSLVATWAVFVIAHVRIHVLYRVYQAEHVIHIRVVAPQEYVNTYSNVGLEPRFHPGSVSPSFHRAIRRSTSRYSQTAQSSSHEVGVYPLELRVNFFLLFTRAWEVARTVVAPPSSVVKCSWEVFVWGCGVLFLSCVSVSGVLFSVGVCVVCVCDMLIFFS